MEGTGGAAVDCRGVDGFDEGQRGVGTRVHEALGFGEGGVDSGGLAGA